MDLADITHPTKETLEAAASFCGLDKLEIKQDDRGFYLYACGEPEWFAGAPDAVRAKLLAPPPVAASLPATERGKGGVCAAVQAWTRANPMATLDMALQQFANVHKTTVTIQFRKARKAAQNP